MESGGLFASPSVENNQVESVKDILTSGQAKVTPPEVNNAGDIQSPDITPSL